MTTHAQLARRLHDLSVRAFKALPEDRRALTYPSLDAFIADPSSGNFLTAMRTLHDEQQRFRLEKLRAAGAQHAFERGKVALAELPTVDGAVKETLGAEMLDPMAGRRLEALALLVAAHHELAARAEFAADEQRKRMGATPVKKLPPSKKKIINRIGA